MRIAQLAPLWMSVPPAGYGGTELIVHLLTEELVRRGHEVTLFAAGDSRTSARLRAVQATSTTEAMRQGKAFEYGHYTNAAVAEVLSESSEFDVIHSHLGCSYIPFSLVSRAPVLHTPHIGLSIDDRWVISRYPFSKISAISNSQISVLDPQLRMGCPVVHHGIDFSEYSMSICDGEYLAFLGRMGPQKSPVDAIKIANLAGIPIVLAGCPQNEVEQEYFSQEVKPLIDGVRVKHIGTAGPDSKRRLLERAAALVFPIRGEEAFGIAMVEAMACGTPVLALRHSSTPEIVDHGVTGFVETSVEDLAGRVEDARRLDRATVRRQAEMRFSHKRMVDDYLEIYSGLTGCIP
jgi:glycosyltransferase involved in cell wall biosynthesis